VAAALTLSITGTALAAKLALTSGSPPGVQVTEQANSGVLQLRTTGSEVQHLVDSNGDRSQVGGFVYRFFQTSAINGNTLVAWDQDGDLGITGTLFENNAFDLAEAFWKSDAAIQAGDVVRVSPLAPDAVDLADTAADSAVLGVVSTKPGIVMGGGAFSKAHLMRTWGEETVRLFEAEAPELVDQVLSRRSDLLELAATVDSSDARGDRDAAEASAEDRQFRLDQELETAALELFFERRFARLALAGRVPVKVDSSYGTIRPGDLLVSSPTPGHAMRADDPAPGTVVGKALEPFDQGTGLVMMLVMNR
jgi:hypothetical protein